MITVVAYPVTSILILMAKVDNYNNYHYYAAFLGRLPFKLGENLRYFFYRNTLKKCGKDIQIRYGAIIQYRDAEMGNHIQMGYYNTIGKVSIGDNVVIGGFVNILSGKKQHIFARTDIPIIAQGGEKIKISLEEDLWIGSNSVIMANIGSHSIVAAGSIVNNDIDEWSVVGGNPAKLIKIREHSGE